MKDRLDELAELIGTIDEISEGHSEECEGCAMIQELLNVWSNEFEADKSSEGIRVLK
jgi:hypothetical protein